MTPAIERGVPAAVTLLYRSSYREVDLVMDRVSEDGYRLIWGHIAGETGDDAVGSVYEKPPQVVFSEGGRVSVWWSPDAPYLMFSGGPRTQFMQRSEMPELPGAIDVAIPLVWILIVCWGTLKALSWYGTRLAKRQKIEG